MRCNRDLLRVYHFSDQHPNVVWTVKRSRLKTSFSFLLLTKTDIQKSILEANLGDKKTNLNRSLS